MPLNTDNAILSIDLPHLPPSKTPLPGLPSIFNYAGNTAKRHDPKLSPSLSSRPRPRLVHVPGLGPRESLTVSGNAKRVPGRHGGLGSWNPHEELANRVSAGPVPLIWETDRYVSVVLS